MTIFLMHPADARAWPAMPQVINRMVKFSQEEHGKLEPDIVVGYMAQFITEIVHPDQVVRRCWVKVEDDGLVSGHVVVDIGNQHGIPFGSVAQFSSDEGLPFSREGARKLLEEIEEWVRSRGGHHMVVRARTSKHARAYRAFYGFKETEQVLMRKEL